MNKALYSDQADHLRQHVLQVLHQAAVVAVRLVPDSVTGVFCAAGGHHH